MKVYVVGKSQDTEEEYVVVSIHRNKQNAIAAALRQEPLFPGHLWVEEGSVENFWFARDPDPSIDETFGCVSVEEFELED